MAISCYAESHGCPPTRFRLRSNANRSSEMSDECGDSHSQSAAQENSQRCLAARRTANLCAKRAEHSQRDECAHRNHCDPSAFGREDERPKGNHRAARERRRRYPGRLPRARPGIGVLAEFVASMGGHRIPSTQLLRDASRQVAIETTSPIDRGEFIELGRRIRRVL